MNETLKGKDIFITGALLYYVNVLLEMRKVHNLQMAGSSYHTFSYIGELPGRNYTNDQNV